MADDLRGHVAIVTGGGRGFGRAIAEGLAVAGAWVTVTARTGSQLEETVASIEAAGGRAVAVEADVTSQRDVERVLRETESKLGPVTLLVSNAAVTEPVGPVWETDPDVYARTIDTNIMGAVRSARAVMPGMIARGRGRVINVSSGAGLRGGPYDSAYRVSKAGLVRLTECMAMEAKDHGISVFAIHPGVESTTAHHSATMTDAGRKWLPHFGEMAERGRTGFEPCVRCCIFLASGAADALSGRFLSATEDFEALVARSAEVIEKDLQTMRLTR